MISIKQFLDQRRSGSESKHDLPDALTQMGRLLLDAMATYVVRGTDSDVEDYRGRLTRLAHQMEGPQTAMSVLGVTSDAVEALETYCERTAKYNREQREERQSMVAMLTDAVADLAGQTDASVGRLQTIEKQLERASELDDIRALKANLGESLQALREAAAHHRSNSAATLELLRAQIITGRKLAADDPPPPVCTPDDLDLIPMPLEVPIESRAGSYVAAVRLRRAEHIASRFGEAVRLRMLTMIGAQLKTMLGPHDRLLRWKGASFVLFLNSREPIEQIRAPLVRIVAKLSQQYIEVGTKTSLLSVAVDWIVFSQAEHQSLEAVFAAVDAFLANVTQISAPAMASR